MEDQIVQLASKVPALVAALSALGSLCVLMTIIAPLTPTKKDDLLLEKVEKNSIGSKVLSLLMRFSLIQKK